VDAIRQFFSNFSGQFLTFWNTLSTPKKLGIGAALIILIGGLAAVVSNNNKEEYEYLFVNLSAADSTEIVAYLKKSNFADFVLDERGLKVPVSKVPELRIKLAQEGLPAQGMVGWEKFDNPDFTRTEFEQKIHKVRAIQGELQRTIMGIEGVEQARVHIVQPRQSLFTEDQKETTAAIYIKTKRGRELDQRAIRGIVHLVSRSVEGLPPDNITIIDFEGKMLTEENSKDPSVRQTKEMLEHTRAIEKNLEERIRAIVGRVVGPERVEAKVDVVIDYTKVEETISEIDPDKVAPVSTYSSTMDLSGTGLNPTGIPGSKSNVPGEQEALNLMSAQTKNNKTNERMNYEVSKKVSHQVMPLGNIKRLSAAVLVDGKQPYPTDGTVPKFEPRTQEEMQKITELVKNAVGFVNSRDQVTVHNMLFQLDPYQVQAITEQKKENREYVSTLALSGIVALSLVFFFAFVVRPYFRWLSYDPERRRGEAIVEEFKPDLELGNIQHVQVKEDVPFDKLSPREQVLYLAKHEPARTTEAIRILLNPHHSAH
jgi:flagellar M-ring protein FliF